MQRQSGIVKNDRDQSAFEQYPWAGNHDSAINWLINYIDANAELIIKEFDNRILKKVARDHEALPEQSSIT